MNIFYDCEKKEARMSKIHSFIMQKFIMQKWAKQHWNLFALFVLALLKAKAWLIGDLLIVDRDRDRDLFFAIEITIGDRHFVKRSQDDRDRRTIAIAKFNDRDRKNAIAIFLAFFSNQPFAGQVFKKCQA